MVTSSPFPEAPDTHASFQVKNTFVEVQEEDVVDEDLDTFDQASLGRKTRQVTEPVRRNPRFYATPPTAMPDRNNSASAGHGDDCAALRILAELTIGEAAKEPQRQSTGDTSEARGSDARRQTTGESVDQEDLVGECSWNRFVTQTSQDHFHPSIEASYIEASNVEASNEEQSGYMILVPQQPWVTPDIGQYQMPFINFTQVGAENPPDDWANTLTVMMRNLPNKFSQQMLLDEINANGFVGAFDFLYLPIDPETRANRGYAFINFVDPYQSWTFKQCYEGRRIGHFNSGKVITVMAATLQGYEANYAHYSSARVCRGDLTSRPLFLRGAPVKQEPVPAQRRRRGRMSLIDAAVKRQQAGGAAGAPGAPIGAAALPGAAFGEGLAPQPQETGQQEEQRTVSFCPFCGGRVKKDFKFCQFCGESLPAA